MIRAKFYEKKPSVEIKTFDDEVYVFIYLNETEGDTEPSDDYPSYHFYEYDYAEFKDLKSNLDLNDIKENPENYLDYEPVQKPTEEEKLQAQILYTAMMTDTILED